MSLLSTKVRASIDNLVVGGAAPLRTICRGVVTASRKATALPAGGLFNLCEFDFKTTDVGRGDLMQFAGAWKLQLLAYVWTPARLCNIALARIGGGDLRDLGVSPHL